MVGIQPAEELPRHEAIKAYPGAAPVTKASGKSLSVTRRRVKNDRHAAGYVWAFSAITASPGAGTLHHQRRDAGDYHAATLPRLFRKLLGPRRHWAPTRPRTAASGTSPHLDCRPRCDETGETPMRKLILQVAAISLDGFICEEGTEFWRSFGPMALPPAPDDDEFEQHFVDSLRRAELHIMGRIAYESMARSWPTSTAPVAAPMNEIPKVVFSATLQSAHWPESRIARGEIARLKAEPGEAISDGTGEIVAHGGARFAQSLARLGLVDEYRLYIYPVAAGSGTPLFTGLTRPQGLRLVASRTFASGITAARYRPMTTEELAALVPAPNTGQQAQAALDAQRRP